MFINEVTLNIYLLAFIVMSSVLAGFSFRSKRLLKYREKIQKMEREILSHCEQILDLERENLNMECRMQDITSPVIAMKTPVIHEELRIVKKVPNISLRKELLGKKNSQSASGL